MLDKVGSFYKNNLHTIGRNGMNGLQVAVGSVALGAMNNLWVQKPALAVGAAIGVNSINALMHKNQNVARLVGLAWPGILLGSMAYNKRIANKKTPPKGNFEKVGTVIDKTLQKTNNIAKGALTTMRNNPIPTAFAACIAAIAIGSHIKNSRDNEKKS